MAIQQLLASYGSAGGGLGAHAYWRINISTTYGPYASIAEIEFRATAGGADQCTGGTPSADTFYSSPTFTADKAFDNNNATQWTSASGMPHWIRYQFASAVSVAEVAITSVPASYGVHGDDLVNFTIEYSDNGTAWTVAKTISSEPSWPFGTTRTYSVP